MGQKTHLSNPRDEFLHTGGVLKLSLPTNPAPSPIEAEGAEGARAVKTETVVEKSYGRGDEGELETIAFDASHQGHGKCPSKLFVCKHLLRHPSIQTSPVAPALVDAEVETGSKLRSLQSVSRCGCLIMSPGDQTPKQAHQTARLNVARGDRAPTCHAIVLNSDYQPNLV